MDEVVVIWETEKTTDPEFRLYHDDKGNVLAYTCEDLEGNYIIVDRLTFVEARPDVKVIDGKLIRNHSGSVISRLHKDPSEGVLCEEEDVSIIADNDQGQYWKLKTKKI